MKRLYSIGMVFGIAVGGVLLGMQGKQGKEVPPVELEKVKIETADQGLAPEGPSKSPEESEFNNPDPDKILTGLTQSLKDSI